MADENVRQYLKERFWLPWLFEDCDETCLEGPALKVGAIGGYGYNWNPSGMPISVDRASRFITIHAGHVEVHQNHRRSALDSQFDGLTAGFGRNRLETVPVQNPREQFTVLSVVIHDQDQSFLVHNTNPPEH